MGLYQNISLSKYIYISYLISIGFNSISNETLSIYIYTKLMYNTLGAVSKVPFLRFCHGAT